MHLIHAALHHVHQRSVEALQLSAELHIDTLAACHGIVIASLYIDIH